MLLLQGWTLEPVSIRHGSLGRARNPPQSPTGTGQRAEASEHCLAGPGNAPLLVLLFIPTPPSHRWTTKRSGNTLRVKPRPARSRRRREKINANSRPKVTKGCFSSSVTALLFMEHLDRAGSPCRCAIAQLSHCEWTLLLQKPGWRGEEGRHSFAKKPNADKHVPRLIVDKLNYIWNQYFWEVTLIIKIVQPYR